MVFLFKFNRKFCKIEKFIISFDFKIKFLKNAFLLPFPDDLDYPYQKQIMEQKI